jgi:hypothetical protein
LYWGVRGNSDLKDEQNDIYALAEPVEGARRWYVARDLGQSFGHTGVIDNQWNDAFRAGAYAEPTAKRFIRRFKEKTQE